MVYQKVTSRDLQQLIGEIQIGQPLSENLNRLDQLSQIFAAPQRAIESPCFFKKRKIIEMMMSITKLWLY